jgi:hypothetical protein
MQVTSNAPGVLRTQQVGTRTAKDAHPRLGLTALWTIGISQPLSSLLITNSCDELGNKKVIELDNIPGHLAHSLHKLAVMRINAEQEATGLTPITKAPILRYQ